MRTRSLRPMKTRTKQAPENPQMFLSVRSSTCSVTSHPAIRALSDPISEPTRSPARERLRPRTPTTAVDPDGVGGTRLAGRMLLEWPQITPSADGITSDERSSKLAGRVRNRTYR